MNFVTGPHTLARCSRIVRVYATRSMSSATLRIGYVPEHFATPLHFAYNKFGLSDHASLQSFPSGTGTMIEAFYQGEIDVGIGLTEAWVVGLSKSEERPQVQSSDDPWMEKPYHIMGSYTLSPLTWAISTGGQRSDVQHVEALKNKKVGVSRIGSGSHVMSSVLAQKYGWINEKGQLPFETVICGPFGPLREAVNNGKADFFMWEHFTSKRYFDNGTLKRIGEIETPWNAWHIAVAGSNKNSIVHERLLPALEQGVSHFQNNKQESIDFISQTMDYSKEDAEAWYEGVKFASGEDMKRLDPKVMKDTIGVLDTAGVLGSRAISSWKDLAAR